MQVWERFLNYVSFGTQSDENSTTNPSTPGQLMLADYLKEELISIGVTNVERDENGYVYGTIPAAAGCEAAPVLALISHMDTAPEASGDNIQPVLLQNYDGRDITLKNGLVTRVADFPALKKYVGETLIVTDGTTLLGADDKAGVAEIVALSQELLAQPELPHPEIRIIFTPDEEVGQGVDTINFEKIHAAYGYTLDGSDVGEIQYENFNAAKATVHIHGTAVHPGSAYHIMKNAALIATEFAAMLPAAEIPAETKGRQGFYHLTHMEGDVENATLYYILRDHNAEILERRMETVKQVTAALNEKYGAGTVETDVEMQYRSMLEKILPEHQILIDAARAAMTALGIEPMEEPIRGGTDGATLSFMGLPCPNLGTGGHAFHGPHEFISVQQMEKAVEFLKELVKRLAEC